MTQQEFESRLLLALSNPKVKDNIKLLLSDLFWFDEDTQCAVNAACNEHKNRLGSFLI